MLNKASFLKKRAEGSLVFLLMCVVGSAVAAPTIQGVSGTLSHKSVVSITGSGFGTKATAAPVVWDDASGTNILDKWDGVWPNNNPTYNTAYRAPMRGISLPHNHITRYIAGAHAQNLGSNGGYNVIFWKNRTISLPAYTYMSWYQRADDNWVFGLGSPADDNYKIWDYSAGTSPYDASNWYLAYGPPGPSSKTDNAQWLFTDDGNSLLNPDQNGHNVWWLNGVNPMAGKWAKVELLVKYTTQNDGYMKVFENGVLKINYLGPTDKYPGVARNEGIGGYARGYGNPNQWRYFADAYLDYTLARVVLANNPNLSNATIIETQIPSSWSSNSISISVNLGQFSTGQTAYMFVVDSTGTPTTSGFPVTVGGGGTVLAPPTNLHVQ